VNGIQIGSVIVAAIIASRRHRAFRLTRQYAQPRQGAPMSF
jgi:hypothetical protein